MSETSPRQVAFRKFLAANDLSTKRVARETLVSYSTLATFMQGGTYAMHAATEQQIADHYGVAIEDVFVHGRKIGAGKATGVPIIGKVFAGPEGSYIDDYASGAHPMLDMFDLDERVAAEVHGESMLPRFRPGEWLIFGPIRDDPTPFINREVMASLADDDGKKLIKVLRPNVAKGLWDLYSVNTSYQVIEGVRLDWVRPFEGLKV
jgi:hypothetical protein